MCYICVEFLLFLAAWLGLASGKLKYFWFRCGYLVGMSISAKLETFPCSPLKAVCYVAHWQASFPLLVLLLPSPLCSSNLTVFASLCPSACWFDISFTCFEHNAGCCFLICPTREEADKAVNAYHNKRTLPGVREHSNRALLACLSLHLPRRHFQQLNLLYHLKLFLVITNYEYPKIWLAGATLSVNVCL